MSWDQCHLLNACLFMPIMRIPLLSYRLSICLAFPVKAGVINRRCLELSSQMSTLRSEILLQRSR